MSDLLIRGDLNNISYKDLLNNSKLSEEFREFNNASLRCTIITNFKSNDVLYDIFYRLNSGSVPLATQELRQVLYRGEFSNFLVNATNSFQPIHKILNLQGPDKRLRDIEVLLILFSIILFPSKYSGNLKKYLDYSMLTVNKEWTNYSKDIENVYDGINATIETLISIFGKAEQVGRKYDKGAFESRFNRVLFEVEVFYFYHLDKKNIDNSTRDLFIQEFQKLCLNPEFKSSIESTTKSIENYKARFYLFNRLMMTVFKMDNKNPFKEV